MSDLTFKASANLVQAIYDIIRAHFSFQASNTKTFPWGSAGYDASMHLVRGQLSLQSDGTLLLSHQGIAWDKLLFTLRLNLPRICVGGNCILRGPGGKCILQMPQYCIFGGNPDVSLTIDLTALGLQSELSASLVPYFQFTGGSHAEWDLLMQAKFTDFVIIDLGDMVGDLIQQLKNQIATLLSNWPDWAVNLVLKIIGDLEDFLRRILNAPNDLKVWLEDLLERPLGLKDTLLTEYFNKHVGTKPFLRIPDPYTLSAPPSALVTFSPKNLAISVDVEAITVTCDVG